MSKEMIIGGHSKQRKMTNARITKGLADALEWFYKQYGMYLDEENWENVGDAFLSEYIAKLL